MKTFRAILFGLLVALIVAASFAFVAVNAQPNPTIYRIAGNSTPTPTPAGGPCHGSGC